MNDLLLWRLLQEEAPDPAILVPLLGQLAALPIQSRFPYFGWLAGILDHPEPAVRAAAVRVLAGAVGYPAYQHLVDKLADADPGVRSAVLHSLQQSARDGNDPGRLVHALFHPDAHVRTAALMLAQAAPDTFPGWYLIYLLADPACAPQVLPLLDSAILAAPVVPLVRQYVERGVLSRPLARRLVLTIPWHALLQYWNLRRLYHVSQSLLAKAESAGDSFTPGEVPPDLLDDVFDLLWDEEAFAEKDPATGEPVPRAALASLRDYLLSVSGSYWEDVVCALVVTAVRRGRWFPEAVEICTMFFPRSLSWRWVPHELRRASLHNYYKFGPQRRGALDDASAQALLQGPFARRPSGQLDLWAIGGLLQFVVAEPIKKLLEWMGLENVLVAFLEDVEDSAALFALDDRSERGARYLLDEILKTGKADRLPLLCVLLRLSPPEQYDFLDDLSGAEAIQVFRDLLRTSAKLGLSLSPNKSAEAAARLARTIVTGDQDETSAFLAALLALPAPAECEFGLLILGRISQVAVPERVVATVRTLDGADLRQCLQLIASTPGFQYGTEVQLALGLRHHPDPEVRAWAQDRVPPEPVLSGRSDRSGARKVTRIKSSVVDDIATCALSKLAAAVEPCLKAPRLGLCAALARRPGTPTSLLEVCAALLACHDPLVEVDREFARFSSTDAGFVRRLESLAVKCWLGEPQLPLLGQAWLYRWQGHRSGLQDGWGQLPDDVVGLLRFSQGWTCELLRQRLWQAIGDVIAVWRWHDKPRFREICAESFGSLLIDGLGSTEGELAAQILLTFRDAAIDPPLVEGWRNRVVAVLPDLHAPVRKALQFWVDSSGLPETPVAQRPTRSAADEAAIQQIQTSVDAAWLEELCLGANVTLVEEAALRLIELGEKGVKRLARLLRRRPAPPAVATVALTVSLWPTGPTRESLADLVRDHDQSPEIRFLVGVGLLQLAQNELLPEVLAAAGATTDPPWFRPEDWTRLLNVRVISEKDLAIQLAGSGQPHAYTQAVQFLLIVYFDDRVRQGLHTFLDAGTTRPWELRIRAAQQLRYWGDFHGLPLLITWAAAPDGAFPGDFLPGASVALVDAIITAFLTAGLQFVNEYNLLELLREAGVEDDLLQHAYQRLLTEAAQEDVRRQVVQDLRRTPARARKLRRVAETYAWGVRRGRELTGRLFQVEMIVGEGLGYTRFEEDRLYISPVPILRGDRHSREIVEGLLLHEIGHHVYHRGPEKQDVWNRAQDDNLFPLLNLVSDEHLERNLRAVDEDFGDRLKKLCAYAFQHSAKEMPVEDLLRGLGDKAFSVLTNARLGVARWAGSVLVDSGRLLLEMEKNGLSFARFMRALRMGLGNRHDDPKVAQGLSLFKKGFRQSSMDDMYQIAVRLREIFGAETQILQTFGQDSLLSSSERELLSHGEGISTEEVQREVRRVLEPGTRRSRPSSGPPGQPWLNVNPNEQFNEIHNIVPVPHNPLEHAKYAVQVKRHAQRLRRYLDELGLSLQLKRFRVRGKSLDRSRLRTIILKGDPRMLQARERVIQTDLFLGVAIDCSGSMQSGQNIEKAKLFGTMLAEATRNHPGVDLRLFGFTDQAIYDAGDAKRCAVHALRADMGNNDAAALWHVAQVARASRRKARLLVMISDGLPTECSVAALKALVERLHRRWHMCCAQVAVQPLAEICFPHYILLNEQDLDASVRRFGHIIARLVRQVLKGG